MFLKLTSGSDRSNNNSSTVRFKIRAILHFTFPKIFKTCLFSTGCNNIYNYYFIKHNAQNIPVTFLSRWLLVYSTIEKCKEYSISIFNNIHIYKKK